MADGSGSGDDLVAKQKELIEGLFKKASEFTEELLRENERLRLRVVQLEGQFQQKLASVEAENREWTRRYQQIEHENNNLANLYVAVHQLHSTLELREVLQTIVEIVLNFVGGKTFAVLLLDEDTGEIRPVTAEGIEKAKVPSSKVGERTVGRVALSGEPSYGVIAGKRAISEEPAICVPLRMKDRVVGVIAVWEMLQQKAGLDEVDYEIFNLLGAHAASALEAARLHAEAPKGHRLTFAALSSLIDGEHP